MVVAGRTHKGVRSLPLRLAGLFAAAAVSASAQSTWEVRDGDLRVATRLGPEVAAQAAAALTAGQEQLRGVGLALQKPHLPIRVALVSSVLELASLNDRGGPGLSRTRAVSLVGSDANYIVVAWHAPGSPLAALTHELVHLAEPMPDAPLWLREGRAEHLALAGSDSAARVRRLRLGEWIPLLSMRFAGRSSPAFSSSSFYPQAWLTVDWLVSRGADPVEVSDADLGSAIRELGVEGVETALREHLDSFPREGRPMPADVAALQRFSPQAAPDWTLDLLFAAFERERSDTQRSADRLFPLANEHPDEPAIAAELGALQMDLKRYDEAEELLRLAVSAPDATARTRRRYALMLLRPTNEDVRARARIAAVQARLAVEQRPHDSYRLTLAQAQMVAGRWAESERLLGRIADNPDYAARVRSELETLRLRQSQSMRAQAPPTPAPQPGPVVEISGASREPSPPPAPPRKTWPPAGVTIVAGQIDFVDCSGREKVVILKSPLFPMRFREPAGSPARIHTPPKDWKTLPCKGAAGLYVNLAYKPAKRLGGRIRGDVVAILF